MAGIGLTGVLTADFLDRFTRVGTKSSLAPRTAGASSEQDSLAAGLRIGARTFSTAIDGLSTAASFVNLSEQSLEQLRDVTSQLIDVTKQATLISTNSSARESLDIRFHKLSSEFRNIVKNATTGDNEFLSKSGLEEVFRSVGLDSKTSSSIANVFSQFITPNTDDALASEYVAGGQERIPVGAFHTHSADSSTKFTKITNSGISNGQITTVNNVFSDTDNILNQNPGVRSLFTTNTVGSTTGIAAGSLSANITLIAVNETNGYSVIRSTDDLVGHNAAGAPNLFLVDPNGVVLQQITANTDASFTFNYASLTQDNSQVAYIQHDSGGGTNDEARLVVLGSVDQDPATYTTTDLYSTSDLSNIAINNAGTYVAMIDASSGRRGVLIQTGTLDIDGTFTGYSSGVNVSALGFYGEHDVALVGSDGVYSYAGDTQDFNQIASANVGAFATLEAVGGHGTVVYEDTDALTINSANGIAASFESFSTVFSYTASDSVSRLSLAFNVDGVNVDYGIQGSLVSKTGSAASQLYRIENNPLYTTGRKLKRSSPDEYDPITGEQQDSIFADSRSIDTRAEAYRTLKDLKALKGQIDKNLSALSEARDLIADNIKLLKATGKAFAEESGRISEESDAEDLANKLRERIRGSTSAAVLAQAGNLNSVTVAALTALVSR
ncbi:MAG: hypothetical protein K1X79_09760 [Oligoflexia bacterium]|nr:hypothetical protein [Oligoflexia bacterium]